MSTPTVASDLVAKHRTALDDAVAAAASRGYWSRYPESPSPRVYGETAAADGLSAYEAHLGQRFDLGLPEDLVDGWVGDEVSPFGPALGVTYAHLAVEPALAAAAAAMPAWRDAGPQVRAAVCVEALDRVNARSFEMASAVMHTTGQPFVMAFQAAGPHAQDRALEAVAYGYAEMTRTPATSSWVKPAGKGDPLRMEKTFHVVPRGVALVVGCNTFPTWNSYSGLFASLVTGNAVVVKPHPRAVLPLAISVAVVREVLAESGFDPQLVLLAPEAPGEGLASVLATRPEVRIVDFTGSSAYGEWLETNARQAAVFTEKAGVNSIVVDSTDDLAGTLANIAFSLSLYSGQMCTTPQNILVPADGIDTDEGHVGVDDLVARLADALDALLGTDARAVELLGAIVNADVLRRVEKAGDLGPVAVASRAVTHPSYPDATVRTPTVVRVPASAEDVYGREHFGPVSLVVETGSTAESLRLLGATARAHGAMTASVYSTSPEVLAAAERVAVDAGVALSCNLTGGVYVNQSSAFSDFHGTGANPAASCALTDAAFVASRFRVVQSRRHTPV